MNRNAKVMASFVAYCQAHPGLRFWQALANWSGASYIFWTASGFPEDFKEDAYSRGIIDTFHWEGERS